MERDIRIKEFYWVARNKWKHIAVTAGVCMGIALVVLLIMNNKGWGGVIKYTLAAGVVGAAAAYAVLFCANLGDPVMDDLAGLRNAVGDVCKPSMICGAGVRAFPDKESIMTDSEANEQLAERLRILVNTEGSRSILLAGVNGDQSARILACALAAHYAATGLKTALINADVRSQELSQILNAGKAGEKCPVLNGVDYIDLFRKGKDPSMVMESVADEMVIGKASENYDITVAVCGNVCGVSDAMRLASGVGGVLLCVESHIDRYSGVSDALNDLSLARANVAGAVLCSQNKLG